MEQIGIAIFGVTAIWLTQQSRETWKKYACIFGMISQPFWFYTTIVHQQCGIFVLTGFYTYSWYLGIHNYWIKPYKIRKQL